MSHEPTLDELVRRYEEARQRGELLSPELICQECPKLLDELRQRIHQVQTWSLSVGGSARGTSDGNRSVAPDGACAVSSSDDNTICLWKLP